MKPTMRSLLRKLFGKSGTTARRLPARAPLQVETLEIRDLLASVPLTAPVLAAVVDQEMSSSQDTIAVQLQASDANGDPLTFSAGAPGSAARELDQRLQLAPRLRAPSGSGALAAKWMTGTGGTYALLANSELRKWGGTVAKTMKPQAVMAVFDDNSYYTQPTRLYNAAAPTALPASLSMSGATLAIDPDGGFTGTFPVEVTVSDGRARVVRTFDVTVQSNGSLYALTNGTLYHSTDAGSNRDAIGTNVVSFGVAANGSVYALTNNNVVCRYTGSGTGWDAIGTNVVSFGVATNGSVYALTNNNVVCRYTGSGTGWDAIGTNVVSFGVATNGSVYALTNNNVVCRYTGSGTGWDAIGTNVVSFGVATNGSVYALTNNNVVCRYTGSGTGWDAIGTNVVSFGVATNGGVYALTNNNVVCRYTGSGTGWDAILTDISSLDLAANGRIFALTTTGLLLVSDDAEASYFALHDSGVSAFTLGADGAVNVIRQDPASIPAGEAVRLVVRPSGERVVLRDRRRVLYVNFDGRDISRAALELWGDDWRNGYDRLDIDADGIVNSPFRSGAGDRERIIRRIMTYLREDLTQFGINVVRITGNAPEDEWGATTCYVGPSTVDRSASNVIGTAGDVDVDDLIFSQNLFYRNDNYHDICFAWGDTGEGWTFGTEEEIASNFAGLILHEAGHTWGLYHVDAPTSSGEVMGPQHVVPQGGSSRFVDQSFQSHEGLDYGPQNSFRVMQALFDFGPGDAIAKHTWRKV